MAEQYTPTTEQVRDALRPYRVHPEEFDRWLAARDAQVLRDFSDGLTRLGVYTFDIHEIRRQARLAGATSHE
jgi:hypothetical protein